MKPKPTVINKGGIHNFIEQSDYKYQRTVFCTKCGQVAWDYNMNSEWNTEHLQAKLGLCISDKKND